MILGVYEAQKAAVTKIAPGWPKPTNRQPKITACGAEPHLAGTTGLSRYFDFGDGPAPESVKDETGHYREVVAYILAHPELDQTLVVRKASGQTSPLTAGSTYSLQVCDVARTMGKPDCSVASDVALSADFYKGDRSMRESGYDISFRFGPTAPGHITSPRSASTACSTSPKRIWNRFSKNPGPQGRRRTMAQLAEKRKSRLQKYLWNGQRGLFVDYDFVQQAQSSYDYVTTFFPLWAGASPPGTGTGARSASFHFRTTRRLVMSPPRAWPMGLPLCWAPNQLMPTWVCEKYGFNKEADRVSYKFLSTVAENFRRDGTIREKYNAVKRSSETQVTAGYHMNIVGFGWTNGVFLELLHDLPRRPCAELASEQGTDVPAPH